MHEEHPERPQATNVEFYSAGVLQAVGGTMLNLSDNGNRQSPDTVWNDGFGASGGGGVSSGKFTSEYQDNNPTLHAGHAA